MQFAMATTLLPLDERVAQVQKILSLSDAADDKSTAKLRRVGVLLAASEKPPPQASTAQQLPPPTSSVIVVATSTSLQEIDAGPKGALRALPVLYLCLGGEMLYVVKHRLEAQNLMAKAQRVVPDIIKVMTQKRAIDEMFQPQPLYSEDAMKQIFQRMAHVSVMTLNSSSMEKLFDLMIMTTKYYILAARHPEEVVQVVLNHLDEMRRMVDDDDAVCEQLDHVYDKLGKTVGLMTPLELADMRHYLLNYILRRNTRLSIFLQQKVQLDNGLFVNNASFDIWPNDPCQQPPGKIRIYSSHNSAPDDDDDDGSGGVFSRNSAKTTTTLVATTDFHPNSAYGIGRRVDVVYKPNMPRTTHLGLNIFGLNRDGATKVGGTAATAASGKLSGANAAAAVNIQQQREQAQVHAANEAITATSYNSSASRSYNESSIDNNKNNNSNAASSPATTATLSSSPMPATLGTAREVDYLARMVVGARRHQRAAADKNNASSNDARAREQRIEISMFDDEDEQRLYQQTAAERSSNNGQKSSSSDKNNNNGVCMNDASTDGWRNAGLMRLIESLDLSNNDDESSRKADGKSDITAKTQKGEVEFDYDEDADLLELMDAAAKLEET